MYEYVQNMYDSISNKLLTSSFTFFATINIQGTDVVHESTYYGMSDSFDGRHTEAIQKNYPFDLPKNVRVRVFPLEQLYTKSHPHSLGIEGNYVPFDKWVACLESDIKIKGNQTYLDFTDNFTFNGVVYGVKGTHRETFGNIPIVYVFLVKEQHE